MPKMQRNTFGGSAQTSGGAYALAQTHYCDIMDPASCLHSLLPTPRSTAITLGSDLHKFFLESILVPSAIVPSYNTDLTTTSKPTFYHDLH